MSFLDADSFIFDSQSSDSYNLMMCWINDTADISANGLRRTIDSGSAVSYTHLTLPTIYSV